MTGASLIRRLGERTRRFPSPCPRGLITICPCRLARLRWRFLTDLGKSKSWCQLRAVASDQDLLVEPNTREAGQPASSSGSGSTSSQSRRSGAGTDAMPNSGRSSSRCLPRRSSMGLPLKAMRTGLVIAVGLGTQLQRWPSHRHRRCSREASPASHPLLPHSVAAGDPSSRLASCSTTVLGTPLNSSLTYISMPD